MWEGGLLKQNNFFVLASEIDSDSFLPPSPPLTGGFREANPRKTGKNFGLGGERIPLKFDLRRGGRKPTKIFI